MQSVSESVVLNEPVSCGAIIDVVAAARRTRMRLKSANQDDFPLRVQLLMSHFVAKVERYAVLVKITRPKCPAKATEIALPPQVGDGATSFPPRQQPSRQRLGAITEVDEEVVPQKSTPICHYSFGNFTQICTNNRRFATDVKRPTPILMPSTCC